MKFSGISVSMGNKFRTCAGGAVGLAVLERPNEDDK